VRGSRGGDVLLRRSAPLALLLALGASLVAVTLGKVGAGVVLTVSAAVGILSAFFLEAALTRILQPGRPRFSRSASVFLVAHLALWGVFLAGLFRWRHDVELWAVAAGLGCFLLGLSIGGMNVRGGTPREE
jgi:hypothetical protein